MTKTEKEMYQKTVKWICNNLLLCEKTPPALSKKIKELAYDEDGNIIYTFEMIYYAAVKNANTIKYAFQNKDFKNQTHKVNYLMVVIANDVDNIKQKVIQYKREQSTIEEQIEQAQDLANHNLLYGSGRYIKKTQNIINERLDDLWQTQD